MNGLTPLDLDFCEFVEVDPTERYGRYNEILGKGASKTVYRAFDEFEGIEVAWNQVKLYDFLQSPEDLERLYCEIHLLKTLKHKNIMKFYTSWVDIGNRNLNFVTELFTSGTLRQYREKHKRVNIRAIKHWCRQILKGLLYLHSHDPPVIHRDLKCDNIFINGNQGEVKIGDLGLAAILRKSHAAHCVGTPEFMAPEVYEEEYNELVDIYSFGMCILEMVTFDYPYSECTHPAQIYKKVISGKKPNALYKVKDPEVREFVEKCLATVSLRLPARELLKDPFLQIDDYGANWSSIGYSTDVDGMGHLLTQPLLQLHLSNGSLINEDSNDVELGLDLEFDNGWGFHPVEIETDGIELFTYHDDHEHSPRVDITIEGRRKEDGHIFLRIRIADEEEHIRNIYFPFNIETDTALSVATEMVAELDILDQDVIKIADMIDGEIASLVPEWNPGPGLEEIARFESASLCQNCTTNDSLMDYLSLNSPSNKNVEVLPCSRHGCTAMHGRFEEITYQVEESEQCVTDGAPMVSSQSDGIQYTDVWAQQESPKLCSEVSSEPHFDERLEQLDCPKCAKDESVIDKNVIAVANHIEPIARNNVLRLPGCHSSLAIPSSVCASSDENENGTRQEMRWLKAMYQIKLRELKDQQLGAKSKDPIRYRESGDREQKIENMVACSVTSTSVQRESDELSKHFASERCFSSYFAHVQNSCPNSETQRARHCEATSKSSTPEHMFTAKSFYEEALLPHSLHRTTSLPVDAVDL